MHTAAGSRYPGTARQYVAGRTAATAVKGGAHPLHCGRMHTHLWQRIHTHTYVPCVHQTQDTPLIAPMNCLVAVSLQVGEGGHNSIAASRTQPVLDITCVHLHIIHTSLFHPPHPRTHTDIHMLTLAPLPRTPRATRRCGGASPACGSQLVHSEILNRRNWCYPHP